VAGGLFLWYKLANLQRLQAELEIVNSFGGNLTLTGIELTVNTTLKNPTAGTITIKAPFVKIQYKDKTIASSEAKNDDFPLPKFSQTKLSPINLNISWASILLSTPGLYQDYLAGKEMDLLVTTVTTLNGKIPYSKTDTITLKKGSNGIVSQKTAK
jgi:hypothetical protein